MKMQKEAIEDKIAEIIDRLTQEVKVEDAAILVGGFYAGMNGYTPLTFILKSSLLSGEDDPTIWEKLIAASFGIYSPFVLGLFQVSDKTTKDDAAINNFIAYEDMDPRKRTGDYIYERLMYLKRLLKDKDKLIAQQQAIIDDYTGRILIKQNEIAIVQDKINNTNGEIGSLNGQLMHIQGTLISLATEMQELWRLISAATDPEEKYRLTLILQAKIEEVKALEQQGQDIKQQISTLTGKLYDYDRQITAMENLIKDGQARIDAAKKAIEAYLSQGTDFEAELKVLDREILKVKLSLGLVGMIEAYSLSRPGTVAGIGEIVKGVGEIIPG